MSFAVIEEEFKVLKKDISRLFMAFDKTESVRFETFCEVWRSLNFSLIHHGRKLWHDKKLGTERLFRILSKYLTEETSFQFRIAALYSLYAVYYTQLCKVKVKIRLTPTMWKDLLKMRRLLKEQQHLDTEFIINKMINDRVFVICAMPIELEFAKPEYMLRIDKFTETQRKIKDYEPDAYVEDLVENLDVIEKMAKVEEDYSKTKDLVLTSLPWDSDSRNFKMVRSGFSKIEQNFHGSVLGFTEDFHRALVSKTTFGKRDRLEKVQQLRGQFVPEKEETCGTVGLKPKELSQGDLRSSLKMKAFQRPVEGAEVVEDAPTDCPPEKGLRKQTLYRRSALLTEWKAKNKGTKKSGSVSRRKFGSRGRKRYSALT